MSWKRMGGRRLAALLPLLFLSAGACYNRTGALDGTGPATGDLDLAADEPSSGSTVIGRDVLDQTPMHR